MQACAHYHPKAYQTVIWKGQAIRVTQGRIHLPNRRGQPTSYCPCLLASTGPTSARPNCSGGPTITNWPSLSPRPCSNNPSAHPRQDGRRGGPGRDQRRGPLHGRRARPGDQWALAPARQAAAQQAPGGLPCADEALPKGQPPLEAPAPAAGAGSGETRAPAAQPAASGQPHGSFTRYSWRNPSRLPLVGEVADNLMGRILTISGWATPARSPGYIV